MELYITYWNASGPAELYDYSVTSGLKQHKLAVDYTTTIYRNPENFTLKKFRGQQKVPDNYLPTLEILKIRKRILVKKAKSQLDLLLVMGNQNQDLLDNESNRHNNQLKQGCIIKLGKTSVEVVKIKTDKRRKSIGLSYEQKVFDEKLYTEIEPKNRIGQDYYGDSTSASTIQEAPCCRYCYQKSINQQNLLAMLCKCEGTSKYVHEQCLRSWILQRCKYSQVNNGVYRANKEGLKCQICKFEINLEEILPCFNSQTPQYLILLIKNAQNQCTYWVIKLDSNQDAKYIVGRKLECHIQLNDLSVSRDHCCIKWNYSTGCLTINDLGSRYGTLMKKDVMEIKKPTLMQVGRTKFLLSVEEQQIFLIKKIKSLMQSRKYLKSQPRETIGQND